MQREMNMPFNNRFACAPSRQTGAALVTALVFLVIITAIALSAMRASTQELRMSLNQELKVDAGQRAQALADGVRSSPGSTPVVGGVGHRFCAPTACDDLLIMPADSLPPDGAWSASVERLGAETRPCPRGSGVSLRSFGCAAFRVQAQFDGSANRRGRADLSEGVLVLVPR